MKRIALIAAGLLAAQAAFAGVYVETVDQNLTTKATSLKQKMYVQGGAGRFLDEDGRGYLIKGDTMYMIDDQDKSYIVFDKATMTQLATKLNSEMEKLKARMASMPPEQRAQMEQMMGGAGGMLGSNGKQWTVEVADTGKSDKVDGRTCKLWDVTRNGELDEQICVVAYSALPGKENFAAVFGNFAKVFDEMAKSVPMLAGMMGSEFAAQQKTNGYPVLRRGYESGKLSDEVTVVKTWREEAVPASMLDIPAGYKQKQMPMGPAR
jgi:hypothetical protein